MAVRTLRPEAPRRSSKESGGLGVSRQGRIDRAVAEPLESRQLFSAVTVNTADVHQTISGLGGNYAFGAITGPYTGIAQDSVGQLTLQYLSPTEARVGLPLAQWAPTNDPAIGSSAWNAAQDKGLIHDVFSLLKTLQDKGIQITLSTWNIPDWMCSNPASSQGREIASGMEGAYGSAVTSFIARAQSVYGVKISYFSVNEADGGFNVVLTPTQEASLIKTVGAQFQSSGLPTKWLVGDTFHAGGLVPYASAILQDSSVLPYVGGISYHTWWSSNLADSSFAAISNLGKQYNLPVFATEVGVTNSGPTSSWKFAVDLAKVYYKILGPGQVNGALDWEFQNDTAVASSDGHVYPVFYVLQQMANTFTPGTQIVGSSSTDSSLLPLAVVNPATGAFSLQVQNTATFDEQVTLNGLPAGTYTLVRTTATEQEANDGTYTVGASGTLSVTLPADSFSTFTTAHPWQTGTPAPAIPLPAGTRQLTGTPSASTTASWDGVSTFASAFDGNSYTYFDSAVPSGNWIQLDLGSPQTITNIAYAPRIEREARMIGGIVEASNDPTFATGVVTLASISGAPADGITVQPVSITGTYQYVRYLSPDGSYGNIAELQVFGPAAGSVSSGSSGAGGGTTTPTSPVTPPSTGPVNAPTPPVTPPVSTPPVTPPPITQLAGTTSANTSGSWDGVSTFSEAFDGNSQTYFDAPTANGNWLQTDLGSAATITQIAFAPRAHFEYRMVGGIFEASNDPTFATGVVALYTVKATPADGSNTVSVNAGGAYRYVRYVAPKGSYGNIAELNVYGVGANPAGNVPLAGTTSANTTGSWDGASTFTRAFDNNITTSFDAPTANGNWVQLDLGAAATITQIAFAPRNGYEQRMLGGEFEASNDPTFSTGVASLYTIVSTPKDGLTTVSVSATAAYRYIRYVAPNGSYGNIAELKVFGNR